MEKDQSPEEEEFSHILFRFLHRPIDVLDRLRVHAHIEVKQGSVVIHLIVLTNFEARIDYLNDSHHQIWVHVCREISLHQDDRDIEVWLSSHEKVCGALEDFN